MNAVKPHITVIMLNRISCTWATGKFPNPFNFFATCYLLYFKVLLDHVRSWQCVSWVRLLMPLCVRWLL